MIRCRCPRFPSAITLGLLCTSSAIAQRVPVSNAVPQNMTAGDSAQSAEALFEQGRQALAAGNYDIACQKLRQSDALDPAPGTKLNLGECEAKRGRVATAWELFQYVETELSADDIRRPIARTKRDAIELRLPHLFVTLADGVPPNAVVQVGHRAVPIAELNRGIVCDPGLIEVTITAPGYDGQRRQVALEEGATQHVVLSLVPSAPEWPQFRVSPLAVSAVPPIPVVKAAPPSRTAGFVLMGVGIGGAAVAGVAGLLTLDAQRTNSEHCPELTHTCDQLGRDAANQGRLFGAITTAGLVVGGLGIGIGTYLIATGSAQSSGASRISLRSDAVGSRLSFERTF